MNNQMHKMAFDAKQALINTKKSMFGIGNRIVFSVDSTGEVCPIFGAVHWFEDNYLSRFR